MFSNEHVMLTCTISMCIFVVDFFFRVPYSIDHRVLINSPNKNSVKRMMFSSISDFKIGMLSFSTFTVKDNNMKFMEIRAQIIATRVVAYPTCVLHIISFTSC